MTYDELGQAPIGCVLGSLRAHAADRTLRSGATVRVFPCISDEFQVDRAARVRFLGLGPSFVGDFNESRLIHCCRRLRNTAFVDASFDLRSRPSQALN